MSSFRYRYAFKSINHLSIKSFLGWFGSARRRACGTRTAAISTRSIAFILFIRLGSGRVERDTGRLQLLQNYPTISVTLQKQGLAIWARAQNHRGRHSYSNSTKAQPQSSVVSTSNLLYQSTSSSTCQQQRKAHRVARSRRRHITHTPRLPRCRRGRSKYGRVYNVNRVRISRRGRSIHYVYRTSVVKTVAPAGSVRGCMDVEYYLEC